MILGFAVESGNVWVKVEALIVRAGAAYYQLEKGTWVGRLLDDVHVQPLAIELVDKRDLEDVVLLIRTENRLYSLKVVSLMKTTMPNPGSLV